MRQCSAAPGSSSFGVWISIGLRASRCGFGPSGFGFLSDFGLRTSDFGLHPGMPFLTPLAFAFAATIPVVIVFYLLKRKRVVKLVSSTLLWQKFLSQPPASAPFQRLRKNRS